MKKLGIDEHKVMASWNKSFVVNSDMDSDNDLLGEDADKDYALGIHLHPGLTINDMTYRGYLDGADVQDAICATFNKQKPKVCKSI